MALASRRVALRWGGEMLCQFEIDEPLHYVHRTELDFWLLQQARSAGAEFRPNTRLVSVDTGRRIAALSDGTEIQFRGLIGADGMTGSVARKVVGIKTDIQEQVFGYEAEIRATQEEDAPMSLDFGIVNPGFGWNFPKFDSATIGLATVGSGRVGQREALLKLIEAEGHDTSAAKVQGAFSPNGRYVRKPARGAVLLVGDAAGLADGVTGEGIAWAVESGALAAEAVAQARAPKSAARLYVRSLKPMHREFDRARRVSKLFYARPFQPWLRDRLAHSPNVQRLFGRLVTGELTFKHLQRLLVRHSVAAVLSRLRRTLS
jgi:flavin-dependent dehydrogenase